ncbi:MAG: hypothetical protein RIC56_16880 [Pseudomonadales bacterium]
MAPPLTRDRIRRDNLAFAGTGGVSQVSRRCCFEAAFRDDATGRVELSRYANGSVAPMHLMDGVPAEWVIERDERGCIRALKASIVAGFVRDGKFYTRDEAACVLD